MLLDENVTSMKLALSTIIRDQTIKKNEPAVIPGESLCVEHVHPKEGIERKK